ncbi:MAG: MFS transporter [Candidatus Omnitrophica bacterium]|nr:MFS transporter [Candidatus Omnitrophota bacterium]
MIKKEARFRGAYNLENFRFVFRALKHRNYRLFFGGQSISLVGTWMQQVAMSWLVYRLTNSALLLGIVGFAGQIPAFLLSPFAGVVADRYNRHRILIVTQTLAMLQAAVLSVLVFSHHIAVWQILVLSLFLGLINSFDIPVRQAFTIEMIEDKSDLGNAIALNSSVVNLARMIGPSVAGILIAVLGEGVCFLFNAISYIAVIVSLLAMRIAPKERRPFSHHVLHDLKEGFVYVFNFSPIKDILMLLALVSLMGVPYQVLMPIFARDIFHGGPKTLGFLIAMSGIGALTGAIYLAGRKSVVGLGRIIAQSSVLFGLGVFVFSFSRVLWFSMAVIFVAGFAMMVQMAASNTVLQTIVEEDKRGRVMSFYTMAFMGMSPFGCLLAGSLAQKIGAPHTLMIGGACCIIGGFLFIRKLPSLREKIHPIYIKKGIIPEVALGIGAASGIEVLPEK